MRRDATTCEHNFTPKGKCPDCQQAYQRAWAKAHRDKGLCSCGREPLPGQKCCETCIGRARVDRRRLRQAVQEAYGGKCMGCGIEDPDVLDLDHVKNNGAAHRKALGTGGGTRMYQIVLAAGCPKDEYQLLCRNCDWKKHLAAKAELK